MGSWDKDMKILAGGALSCPPQPILCLPKSHIWPPPKRHSPHLNLPKVPTYYYCGIGYTTLHVHFQVIKLHTNSEFYCI